MRAGGKGSARSAEAAARFVAPSRLSVVTAMRWLLDRVQAAIFVTALAKMR
ncbi:MAG: hypothetical protein ACJ8GK_04065 [Luteimonas sp.]